MSGKIRHGFEWIVTFIFLFMLFVSYDQYFLTASIGLGIALFILITDYLFMDSNQFLFDPFYNNWIQKTNY